jgi:diketogulonate reductase-like aldo/keto reductase
MNKTLAMGYIHDELAQLQTDYVDLLLFHHRCKTEAETAAVWSAFEDAKAAGLAQHIGVSNFNTHDLRVLLKTATRPVEVLEAHFGVGLMDFEVLDFANQHSIHPVAFSSLSETSTDLDLSPVAKIAAAHNATTTQIMYSYVATQNITVLSSYDPQHPEWLADDMSIFDIKLSADDMDTLDQLTAGKRSCPDCFTDECQACAMLISSLGCPIGPLHSGFVWGRSNPNGTECLACAALPEHRAAVNKACGDTSRGESLETMVPKSCGI